MSKISKKKVELDKKLSSGLIPKEQYDIELYELSITTSKPPITDDLIISIQKMRGEERLPHKDIAKKTRLTIKEVKDILEKYGTEPISVKVEKIMNNNTELSNYVYQESGFELEELRLLSEAKELLSGKTKEAAVIKNTIDALKLPELARQRISEMLTSTNHLVIRDGLALLAKMWTGVLTVDCDLTEIKLATNDMQQKLDQQKLDEKSQGKSSAVNVQNNIFINTNDPMYKYYKNHPKVLEMTQQSDAQDERISTKH